MWWFLAVAFAAPRQFIYNGSTIASESTRSGCVFRSWNGTDASGMTGPPALSTINCTQGTATLSGVATASVTFYVAYGRMSTPSVLDTMGDAYWAAAGAHVNVTVGASSMVYWVGGSLVDDAVATSSLTRVYASLNATNVKDPHIGNGTANARDLTFSAELSPPSITVINCDESFVWYHLHPGGALYLPFAGAIYFETDTLDSASLGAPRWVAPNLFYYEYFRRRDEDERVVAAAAKLVDATFQNKSCTLPIAFAVTNFDPDDVAGQPNFDAMPNGPARWGFFPAVTAHLTTPDLRVVHVD